MTYDFEIDEMNYLNNCAVDVSLEDFLAHLNFNLLDCDDEDALDFLSGIKDKISDFSGEEWDNLQSYMPFEVPYNNEDTIEFAAFAGREV